MIKLHEFNTAWWGAPTGIVTDAAFFALPLPEQRAALQAYEFVEFRAPLDERHPHLGLRRAGFFWADTRLAFRLDLRPIAAPSSNLEVISAADSPFTLGPDDLAHFEHEPFIHLPGITADRLTERYARFARQVLAEHPGWCMRVSSGGVTQGWFFARPQPDGLLNLTLAALHRRATISGAHVYRAGTHAYGRRGARLGTADFSVLNTPVPNIYAALGARFLTPRGGWLWIRSGAA
jgi:hypothetical protein